MTKIYTVVCERDRGSNLKFTGTIEELVNGVFGYTLDCGRSYQHEKGNSKINTNPKSAASLITNLNKAVNNSAANGYAGKRYFLMP